VALPKEVAPGVTSPRQQARSGIHCY
jgi:hypothetical protein